MSIGFGIKIVLHARLSIIVKPASGLKCKQAELRMKSRKFWFEKKMRIPRKSFERRVKAGGGVFDVLACTVFAWY